jgi:GT2 family glycosyltransferase
MKSFFNCSLFEDENCNLQDNFVVKQQELLLKNSLSDNNFVFDKVSVEYSCNWIKQDNWDNNKPTILIPIKDNVELLTKTVKNLEQHRVIKICNVIVIDDRSKENIKKVAIANNLSYLRVYNKKGFNFSMLNNIAAFITHKLNGKEIILWNSDLWCVEQDYFIEFIKRHRMNNSTISGSKLIYPPIEESMNKELDSDNIKQYFSHMKNGAWRETIQFGGAGWVPTSLIKLSPTHSFRFKNKLDNRVNCDKGETFVTGALQLINLEWFISSGGMNPSLSKNFQDVDLCLRAIEQNKNVFYFGKDIYFYHDESLSLMKEGKNDLQLQSDHVLFSKLWNEKIISLVL